MRARPGVTRYMADNATEFGRICGSPDEAAMLATLRDIWPSLNEEAARAPTGPPAFARK